MTNSKQKVLVTGAAGFIGALLCESLVSQGYAVQRVLRRPVHDADAIVAELGPDTNWAGIMDDIDCVIHLAALVHVTGAKKPVSLNDYRRINVAATLNLARQAAEAGVRRFIYLSSIKVNGESTEPGKAFAADSVARPADPYAVSKWEAEQALFSLSEKNKMEIVCIRPPLVYGPGVKANFHNMMRWIHKGIPLPFAGIANKRSLVGVDNLVDLILTCIGHPAAANQTFMVSDGHDLSTAELLRRTAQALNVRARLFTLPVSMLSLMASLVGKPDILQRLTGSLQVDISKTRQLLDWSPPCSFDEELSKTAAAFLQGLPETIR